MAGAKGAEAKAVVLEVSDTRSDLARCKKRKKSSLRKGWCKKSILQARCSIFLNHLALKRNRSLHMCRTMQRNTFCQISHQWCTIGPTMRLPAQAYGPCIRAAASADVCLPTYAWGNYSFR